MKDQGSTSPAQLVKTIRRSIIGEGRLMEGPFGPRRITYADYTASGRSLSFIEDFIRDRVMPLYANTHSETSTTGSQTNHYREEAREIIKNAVDGTDKDVVIFCGSGATAAVWKMVDLLDLRLPRGQDKRHSLRDSMPAEERPVVFIGPYEHHSNELPWRESVAEVVVIDEDPTGNIDEACLEEALVRYRERPLKIGSFSAASNVTGIRSDTTSITMLLHRHGALALWDFAAAGPYVRIEMNPRIRGRWSSLAAKDAVFISPHKFIGGPGTPGVLVVKKRLLKGRVPTMPGGGTVSYVSSFSQRYLRDPVLREEGGTPAIVESIRAGLVFKLKDSVGVEFIEQRERELFLRAMEYWAANSKIEILGSESADRISIISFVVRHQEGHLHHNFVVALLNDLFGIQARGGCSCAGPYGHRLLHIGRKRSREFEREIVRGHEGVKPGWVRVNFNYFISDRVFRFILRAVDMVARDGWKLLPQYEFDSDTGAWRHRSGMRGDEASLGDLAYEEGEPTYPPAPPRVGEDGLAGYLKSAEEILLAAGQGLSDQAARVEQYSPEFERLRWFPLPEEIVHSK